ncbi:helix-turn-helix transcriptional regulator [Pseudokineococcus sp. 5B2Z-1]|uniref:helix-turn-helix transcriptional regulator n=1 Tax=Pseudokineococcus sp. 5B2Z-1 TaxID=3132744 RepID=UPI003099D5E5
MSRGRAMFTGSDGAYRADPTAPMRRAGARGDIGLWAWGRPPYPGAALADDELEGMLSAGLWEVEAPQDWGLDWHLNEGVEVTFVTHGRVGFSSGEDQHDLQRGWVTVTRPWQRHRVGLPHVPACTLGWFVLDVGALRPNQPWTWPGWLPLPDRELAQLTDLLRGHDRCVWLASPELVRATERLERTMRAAGPRTVSRLGLGVSEVVLELLEVLEGEEPELDPYFTSTERTVDLFLRSLRSRLDEPWTVDDMARECGMGRTSFVHYCRLVANTSPMDHLTGLRVERALELLTTTDESVADVAMRCGFSSSQYFATVFRRHFDRSPSEARRAGAGG